MRRRLIAAALIACGCAGGGPSVPVSVKLKNAVESAQKRPPCSTRVPAEWAASWPVPSGSGATSFKVLFYPLEGNPEAGPRLSSPGAEAVVDAADGRVASCDLLKTPPVEISKRRWSAKVERLGMSEFEQKADRLLSLTEIAGRAYAAGAKPEDAPLLKAYAEAFNELAEPDLKPDYYRLNPAFWDWLRGAAGDSLPKP
jgi:hypothetical protein